MQDKRTFLTQQGFDDLERELQHLKVVKRKEVAEKIKEARSQGDLSENAEYHAAKEEQAEIEARISAVEGMLRNAEVIEEDTSKSKTVKVINIGYKVTVLDTEYNEEAVYTLVGSAEADPTKGKISNESPLGQALIGRKKGETIEIDAPSGTIAYKILKIEKK